MPAFGRQKASPLEPCNCLFISCQGQHEQKDKLIHSLSLVFTPLYFDVIHVVLVCFMSSLFCAHAATSSPCA